MSKNIVVCIMGQNCEKFLPMCLGSVKNSDAIVYCDGGSSWETISFFDEFKNVDFRNGKEIDKCVLIENEYKQDDPKMNGKQRNFYLSYLKEKYKGWYALCLDADEVCEDFDKIREWVNAYGEAVLENGYPAISIKMRHFHGDLGREDATRPEHFVLNRLFYICDELEYPEVEHPVLYCKGKDTPETGYACRATTIWHLAHIQHCFEIKKRYEKNLKHSNMHSKEYLDNWYLMHLMNQYPTSAVNPLDVPAVIWENFNVDKDMFYFANRNVETKHFMMAKQYLDYYRMHYAEPTTRVIEFGCGKAPFGFAFNFLHADYKGIELSNYAVKHAFVPIEQGDIITWKDEKQYDLCLVFDVLEHLKYEDLDKALENIKLVADTYIFSIPFVGDHNLEADSTHIIKETKDWWIAKLTKYFNLEETPKEWHFRDQIIIGRRK